MTRHRVGREFRTTWGLVVVFLKTQRIPDGPNVARCRVSRDFRTTWGLCGGVTEQTENSFGPNIARCRMGQDFRAGWARFARPEKTKFLFCWIIGVHRFPAGLTARPPQMTQIG